MINEKNLIEYVESLYKSNKSWVKTFDFLSKNIIAENLKSPFSSILSNYLSIFIYNMVDKQIDLKSFDEIIKHIYQKTDAQNLEFCFNRFFNYSSVDINITEYHKKNSKPDIWDHIFYCFLSLEDKKVIFKKEKLPYLLNMLNNIDENTIQALHYGKFPFYCLMFESNLKELKPIFEIQNLAFKENKEKEYRNISGKIVRLIASNAYEKTDDINIENFNILNQMIDISQILKNESIYSLTINNNITVKLDPSIINFSKYGEVDLVSHIDCVFKDVYNTNLKYVKDKYANSNLIREIASSVNVYFSNISDFDPNKIDTSIPFVYNLVYLTLLDLEIKEGKELIIEDNIIDYLKDNFKEIENNDINYDLKHIFNVDKILKYLDYSSLNKKLEKKSIGKKIKV